MRFTNQPWSTSFSVYAIELAQAHVDSLKKSLEGAEARLAEAKAAETKRKEADEKNKAEARLAEAKAAETKRKEADEKNKAEAENARILAAHAARVEAQRVLEQKVLEAIKAGRCGEKRGVWLGRLSTEFDCGEHRIDRAIRALIDDGDIFEYASDRTIWVVR